MVTGSPETDPFDSLPGGLRLFLRNLHSLVPIKLDDSNYPSWSSTVKATLQAHRLFGYVDGSVQAPTPTILDEKAPVSADKQPVLKPNPAYDQWLIIDAQLRASLLALLSPTIQNLVHLCSSAAEIWDHLHTCYNSLSRTHIFQLKEQLNNLHKGHDSMQKYLDSVLGIVSSLALAREPVPEQDIILSVLRGFPSEYASLKQNIGTNITDLTFNKVSSWLLSEELNLQMEQKLHLGSSSSPSNEVHTALYTTNGRGESRRGRGRGRSFNGRRGGRTSGGGRFQSDRGRGRGPYRASTLVCQICGKFNHGAWQCWNRYNEDFSGPPHFINNAQALYTTYLTDTNQNWHLDSGATTHVTSDLSRLHNPLPYHGPNSVSTAGGQSLPISYVGSGKVSTPADTNQNWHLDSGATTHVTSDLSRLHNPLPYHGPNSVSTAGGQSLPISYVGSGKVSTPAVCSFIVHSYCGSTGDQRLEDDVSSVAL
ncbi:unnamed protein product [Cuscuta campestris]|uniref:Uncharacterized protein n=1 Tax=Cuscuta campestris TaxID=132261 RepID=A0A484L797_9ASTE|nr:unnamed protein product [Cuscuta campestris]